MAKDEDIRLWHEHRVLKAMHLQGREWTLQIESVTKGKITGEGGKSDQMPIVKFRGTKLPLGLNKTNTKTLGQLYGYKASQLEGRWVTLYPTTTKGKAGDVVDCIRIRPEVPRPRDGSAQEAPGAADPNDDGREAT